MTARAKSSVALCALVTLLPLTAPAGAAVVRRSWSVWFGGEERDPLAVPV